ncbi:hypothetical protein BEN71_11020 [Acinetobacter wuhouensis]|uniref:hypothetical protein n=1 Tax=Acinetobacter wuhouensis TaxID=1879050 RepID=UPI000839E7C9|nr:hypothetical protein [Acinetobacter wuhouensis]AXQ22571.1 hypothetical protein BEN71_11020 [Acinetobacter wuhouensis]
MASFYSPQVSQIGGRDVELRAYNPVDIDVVYRDTSGLNSANQTILAEKIKLDLSSGYDEQVLTGSVRFKIGNDTFLDRNGTLYRNVDPATNSGVASGMMQYGNGNVELDTWTPNIDNSVILQSLTTTTDLPPVNKLSFRTPIIPIRPQSLTIVISSLDFGQLTLTADENGVIETSRAHGKINYITGLVELFFYIKTEITATNRPSIEAKPWYDVLLEYEEAGKKYLNVPVWVDASSARYNAIAYTYIPLDAEILGLSATRLPLDGRVPVFRVGGMCVLSSSKEYMMPDHVAGKTYVLDDQRISWCELEDSKGVKVPYDQYVVDYDYGRFTLSGDFAVNAFTPPFAAKYRYQDMGLIRDVQISGQITFTKPVTHNYDAENTIVGSALVIDDMQARYTHKFVQQTWNNIWSDEASGGAISANYNDAIYPIQMTNKGAIQERWALVFTSGTGFKCIGEYSGEVGTGTVNEDFTPINPITKVPYFIVKKEGWGAGWANSNVLRFNSISAMYPVWVIRTVKQSEPTQVSDQFQIMLRGDIDRIV